MLNSEIESRLGFDVWHKVVSRNSEAADKPRIWLCDCGRVHVERRSFRISLEPAEFIRRLREATQYAT